MKKTLLWCLFCLLFSVSCSGQTQQQSFMELSSAALKGSSEDLWKLGEAYWNGEGTQIDIRKAFLWWKKAAETGDPTCQWRYGWKIQQVGLNENFDVRRKEALNWFIKAANKGETQSMIDLGDAYMNGDGFDQDSKKGLAWYEMAAEKDNPTALNKLGNMYEYGIGVQANPAKAFQYFEKAASLGSPFSQSSIARMYLNGKGVARNPEKAVPWLIKAAGQGQSTAQWELARCYEKGFGIDRSQEKSMKWLLEASKSGQKEARFALANCYLKGKGIKTDLVKACALLETVAREMLGEEGRPSKTTKAARELIDQLKRGLSQTQLAQVREECASLQQCQPDSIE